MLVARAIERGELPARHTDARSLPIAATAPLYHELVLLRANPDPQLPERAAEAAVLAAAAGAFSVRTGEEGSVVIGEAGRRGANAGAIKSATSSPSPPDGGADRRPTCLLGKSKITFLTGK
jgi:hypothetical protein